MQKLTILEDRWKAIWNLDIMLGKKKLNLIETSKFWYGHFSAQEIKPIYGKL